MTGTALVLTLSTFGLAACGGSDDKADDTKEDTTSQADPTTEAPADSAESEDKGEDGKPSKDEVVDGYTKLVGDLMGDADLPGNILDKVVTCFVDEVYDDASAQTLNAIADGNQAGVDPADVNLFTEASGTCQKVAMG
ncbi:hypothetical protein [Aeromicrobium sp. UC242_57]|uniref:hypothetical protein n=1 Tax=Aeromicrobium sp. UC242_57 TaxID=3374624 RepID=UPI003796FA84